MPASWVDIEWDADRPEWSDITRSHEQVRYEPFEVTDTRALAMLEQLRATHVNGGALLGAFRVVDVDDVFRWFASRNRFGEYDFFAHFLRSTAVRDELPGLQVPSPLGRELGFQESWSGTLTLDGELAATLIAGGAYERFKGTPIEAKHLGITFVDAVVGERHNDFRVYRSHTPWSPYFYDVAWDVTWVLLDGMRGEVFLLCVTDTD
jgi:hypothetical protein